MSPSISVFETIKAGGGDSVNYCTNLKMVPTEEFGLTLGKHGPRRKNRGSWPF
jgi:hypothetical protein